MTKQIEKLKATEKNRDSTENGGSNHSPVKDVVTFDDFTRMDVRIGEILHAEEIPKSKKLLKLTVNTGIGTRTVVSGIAGDYTAEAVIGAKVCILVNLVPRKIMGIESQGMILMCENPEGNLAFLQPDKEIENGSIVS